MKNEVSKRAMKSKASDKLEKAKEYGNFNFYNGLSCAESVYEALLRSGVVDESDAAYSTCALCAGFGGGLGLTGLNCGALSAAVMAVGAKHGRKDPHNDKPDGLYDVEYHRYNCMVNEFIERMGTAICAEIGKDYLGKWDSPERKAHCANAVTIAIELSCKYIDISAEEILKMPWGYNITE